MLPSAPRDISLYSMPLTIDICIEYYLLLPTLSTICVLTATRPFALLSVREFPELNSSVDKCLCVTNPIATIQQTPNTPSKTRHHPYTMAAFSTRINLLPTSRTLASGVPFAPRIALVHPPASHGHGTHGPRSDVPPKWTGSQGGYASNSRINSESAFWMMRKGKKSVGSRKSRRRSDYWGFWRKRATKSARLTHRPSYRHVPTANFLYHSLPSNRGSAPRPRCPRLVRIPVFWKG